MPSEKITYTEVFSNWLLDAGKKNKQLCAITPAMADGSGLTNFAKKYPNSVIVPYNASSELLQSAIGNNVDIAIGFLNLWKGQIESRLVNPLGISGGDSYLNIPNLEGQIAKNMVNNFVLVANQSLDSKL